MKLPKKVRYGARFALCVVALILAGLLGKKQIRDAHTASEIPRNANVISVSSAPESVTESTVSMLSEAETLQQLRNTPVYRAVQKLNPNADFLTPDAVGPTKYSTLGTSADGFEKLNGKPDYAKMQQKKICCAAFVNYYLWNYLPNEENIQIGYAWQKPSVATGEWGTTASPHTANSVDYALLMGGAEKIFSVEQLKIGQDYSAECQAAFEAGKYQYEIGDVLLFSDVEYRWAHVAIYAGYYNGAHWLAHATGRPDNIGVTLTPFNGYLLDRTQFQSTSYQTIHVEYVTRVWRPY